MNKILGVLIVVLINFGVSIIQLYADNPDIAVNVIVDWEQHRLLIDATSRLNTERYPLPKAKLITEGEMISSIPVFFMNSLSSIFVDSFYSLSQVIRRNPVVFTGISSMASRGEKELSFLSQDLEKLTVRFSFPFFGDQGIINHLITHTIAYPLDRILGFVPNREFTGLVIFAKGSLRSVGKPKEEVMQPALFPRIFDEDMNLILDHHRCSPEFLQRWGMVEYSDSANEIPHLARIGFFPLRTVARGVFGAHSTDILVPADVAQRLLSRQENINILVEGRILIVVDRAEAQIEFNSNP